MNKVYLILEVDLSTSIAYLHIENIEFGNIENDAFATVDVSILSIHKDI